MHDCASPPFAPQHCRGQRRGEGGVFSERLLLWKMLVHYSISVLCVTLDIQCLSPFSKELLRPQNGFSELLMLGACLLVGNSTPVFLITQIKSSMDLSLTLSCLLSYSMGIAGTSVSFSRLHQPPWTFEQSEASHGAGPLTP